MVRISTGNSLDRAVSRAVAHGPNNFREAATLRDCIDPEHTGPVASKLSDDVIGRSVANIRSSFERNLESAVPAVHQNRAMALKMLKARLLMKKAD